MISRINPLKMFAGCAISFSLTACNTVPALHPQARSPLSVETEARVLSAQTHQKLNPQVAKLALMAFYKTQQRGISHKPILTVIDYSKPSTERRFWVIDLRTDKVLYQELVAHGKNSGANYATHFSDSGGSRASSIGTFVTSSSTYQGQHGTSLRIDGLEPGFNRQALNRGVVVHGAAYVSDDFAKKNGRLGLSWGCPALNPRVVKPVINQIKGGSVIFAYYPDPRWLRTSQYVRG